MSFLNKIFGIKTEFPLKDKRVYIFGSHDLALLTPIATKLGGHVVSDVAECLSNPEEGAFFANSIHDVPEEFRRFGIYKLKYLLDAKTKPYTRLERYVIASSEGKASKTYKVAKQSAVAAAAGVERLPMKRKNTEEVEEGEHQPERKARRAPKPFTKEEDQLILDMIRKRPDLRLSKSYYKTICLAMGETHPAPSIRTRFRYHLSKDLEWVYEVDATGVMKRDSEGHFLKRQVGDSFTETKANFTAEEDFALSKAVLANGGDATTEVFEKLAKTNKAHKADQWRNRWRSKVQPYGAKKFVSFYEYAIRSGLEPYPLGKMSSSNKTRRKRLHPNDFISPEEDKETIVDEEDESLEEIDDDADAPESGGTETVKPASEVGDEQPIGSSSGLSEASSSQPGPQVGASQSDESEDDNPVFPLTQRTRSLAPISQTVLNKYSSIEAYIKKVRACIEFLDGSEEEIFDELESRLGMDREWAKKAFHACSGDPDPFCQLILHTTTVGGETKIRGFFTTEEDNDLLLERNLDELRDKHSDYHLSKRMKFLGELKKKNYIGS